VTMVQHQYAVTMSGSWFMMALNLQLKQRVDTLQKAKH